MTTTTRGTSESFGALKRIDAGVLDVGYAEAGPADGRAVLLLHGWPYDIHSYVEVAPWLADAGYRVIVPHLRGYGTTRFLSSDTLRNGQQSVVALDIIARNAAEPATKTIGMICQAHLADSFSEMGLRRRHLRSQRSFVEQSGSCQHRRP
jgi:pimeloyl-ACP methyl ester carboxylesterase